MRIKHDLTGQRFGKQVVLKELGAGLVEIQCDCGVLKTTPKQYLLNGQSKSCGCGRYSHRKPSNSISVGDRHDRLVVKQLLGSNGRKRELLVECDCGTHKVVCEGEWRAETTKSCGCLRQDRMKDLNRTHGEAGRNRTYLYRAWEAIKRRISDPIRYPSYAGRGITIYPAWEHDYEAFAKYIRETLGERPKGMSLDRIDNDKNYEPGNLRWASPLRQTRNRSSNKFITIDGVTRCQAEWAELSGTDPNTICVRLKRGYSTKDAVFTPIGQRRKL